MPIHDVGRALRCVREVRDGRGGVPDLRLWGPVWDVRVAWRAQGGLVWTLALDCSKEGLLVRWSKWRRGRKTWRNTWS